MPRKFDGSSFYKLTPAERLKKIQEFVGLDEEQTATIKNSGGLSLEKANFMIENVIGTYELPLGLAMNFCIDGQDYIIPMAIEEASVVAAASKMAKIARIKGGFTTDTTESMMIGQIQLADVSDPNAAKIKILAKKDRILDIANRQDPMLVAAGGGAKSLEIRIIEAYGEQMLICHLLVDCKDAMGANAVNTMAEAIAPEIETITGGRVYLRIISNLAVKRLARAYAIFDKEKMGGEDVVDGIIRAYRFADNDPFRAATHNKGIMNGISAVALATGQDTRAIEAGAHAYASITGQYRSLTTWEKDSSGDLVGTIELPMAVGLVGGITKVHPGVKANLKILGVTKARELAKVMAAVGLAQNVGALRALAAEGIQRGHMSLHARNIAMQAGSPAELVDTVVEKMVKGGKVRLDIAKKILEELTTSNLATL